MATVAAAELHTGLRRDIDALMDKLTRITEQPSVAGDPEAAAEIEAVQADADQKVAETRSAPAREVQRRQQAESDAAEARNAMDEADERARRRRTLQGGGRGTRPRGTGRDRTGSCASR